MRTAQHGALSFKQFDTEEHGLLRWNRKRPEPDVERLCADDIERHITMILSNEYSVKRISWATKLYTSL